MHSQKTGIQGFQSFDRMKSVSQINWASSLLVSLFVLAECSWIQPWSITKKKKTNSPHLSCEGPSSWLKAKEISTVAFFPLEEWLLSVAACFTRQFLVISWSLCKFMGRASPWTNGDLCKEEGCPLLLRNIMEQNLTQIPIWGDASVPLRRSSGKIQLHYPAWWHPSLSCQGTGIDSLGDSACSWSHRQQLETQGDSAVSMETAHLQLNVINRCCNNLERWRKCFEPSVVYGGSVDVQICSVMTEPCVNTLWKTHRCVCVCVQGEILHVGTARGSGGPFFYSQLLLPLGEVTSTFCSIPVHLESGAGDGIVDALGWVTVMRWNQWGCDGWAHNLSELSRDLPLCCMT